MHQQAQSRLLQSLLPLRSLDSGAVSPGQHPASGRDDGDREYHDPLRLNKPGVG